uniref:Bifunctional inhibitor/plant lipid transfer protein/seed storage helical domain-containing protein n=1 Tax=Ananas comosus var. bracteatus TaxID=296719 RepID=A0A6V7QPP3_ANACO|nr:unnamed protein product [Ananas comosus var. bracteatus]
MHGDRKRSTQYELAATLHSLLSHGIQVPSLSRPLPRPQPPPLRSRRGLRLRSDPKPPSPTPIPPTPYTPTPPTPYTPPIVKCPIDTLKLGACANLLNGLINFELGKPPKKPCCSLLGGLADAEVALCLCTVLKANVLGINLNIPIDLTLLVNYCGKNVPPGFQCP